jgi:leader peptidase (prepilin peptidase)/N-methyltransferase
MSIAATFELAAFAFGLLCGSFLNVCIARLPLHESVVKPRSHCPRCGHTIRWYDNIPLLSFVLLLAKCRDCGARIPWRYPLVEIGVGVWFIVPARLLLYEFLARSQFGQPTSTFLWQAIAFAILGFLLIGLLVMDWQTHTLPDAFTLTGTAIGFLLVCTQAIFLAPGEEDIKLNPAHSLRMSSPGSFVAKGNVFLTGPEHLVFGRIAAIVAAAMLPFLIRAIYKALRGREGLGLGDVKLMAMIAAFLGFAPALLSFCLGCIFVLPYALYLLATKKADRATQLPFGSFLCAGGLVAALVGEPLIAWYRGLL